MALPATGISLGAVNTELGATTSSTINLNEQIVRSLADASNTVNSTVSMSQLASKSSSWLSLFNYNSNWTNTNYYPREQFMSSSLPVSDLTPIRYALIPPGPPDSTINQDVTFKQLSVNGTGTETYILRNIWTDGGLGNPSQLLITSIATQGNFNSDTWITTQQITTEGSHILHVVYRFSSTGTLVAGKILSGNVAEPRFSFNDYEIPKRYSLSNVESAPASGPVCHVDNNGNSYFFNGQLTMSLNSSLDYRWARNTPNNSSDNRGGLLGFDSSNNVYTLFYGGDNQNFDRMAFGFMKLNSSNGDVLTQVLGTGTNGRRVGGTVYYSLRDGCSGGVNSSGTVVITYCEISPFSGFVTRYIISVFNTSGTHLWSRSLNSTVDSEFSNPKAIIDDSGNVYFAARMVTSNTDPVSGVPDDRFRFNILKLDSSGNVLWQRRFTFERSSGLQFNTGSFSDFIFGGKNKSILYLTCSIGTFESIDEYTSDLRLNPFVLAIKGDGSGTGTSTMPSPSTGVSAIYSVNSSLVVTSGGDTGFVPITPLFSTSIITKTTKPLTNTFITNNLLQITNPGTTGNTFSRIVL
jgi:hypothetical protein